MRLAQVEAQQRELVRLALEPRAEEGDRVARALLVACELAVDGVDHEEGGLDRVRQNNKGKHAIDIAELYNRKGEGSIKDLLYDYKEKRRLERIAKGDYQRKGIPPDRKGKYEL